MHCNVYPIFVKFVRLTHSNKELLTYFQQKVYYLLLMKDYYGQQL